MAPSVGLSQPWRFVVVDNPDRRRKVIENFESCNEAALKDYTGAAGLCVGPDDMNLGLRGLRTMGVRLARHHAAGLQVARWLAVPCRKLFEAKPMPELEVPVVQRPSGLTSITY